MARNIDPPPMTPRVSSEMPLIASIERSAEELSVAPAATPDDMQQQYIALQAQCEQLRQGLATEIHARKSDQAVARKNLERVQDLNAALFRIRRQLQATEMDAQEYEGRCVDLEVAVRELGERREADLQEMGVLRAQLGQALDVIALLRQAHEQESARARSQQAIERNRWQTEIERVRAHSMETSSLLADVLSSRSWSMTRPLRRLVELARGRSWREPQVPALQVAWIAADSPLQAQEGVTKSSEGAAPGLARD